jgi:hypothetical protein
MSILSQARMYGRFAWGLREFLREPLTPEQSREIIRQRMQNRQRNLLLLVKRAIYENKASPYRTLLKLAGCEYGDFEQMVRFNGIEATLKKLANEGVYVSVEEFKGRKEIIRGGKVVKFKESDFDNPFISGHFEAGSGMTRSAGTRTIYDLNYLTEDLAVYLSSSFEIYGVADTPVALWYPIMPGAGPLFVLGCTKAGKTPTKWFSPVERRGFRPALRNRIGTNYLVHAGRLFGARWPAPEYVPLDDAWRVAEWLADVISRKGGCYFGTYASAAVRICHAAQKGGISIAGTIFFTTGEPATQAKRKEIESSKAIVYPYYAFMEVGAVGYGCVHPIAADEVHFFKDKLALIQQHTEVPHAAVSIDAFLFTTLMPSAPKILLNVESGDYGVVETRNCGCGLEELGFIEHIHDIRGFDKLTGEGMTFISMDLVRIIDEILPARFGGSSTDYQMVEEEDEQGHTMLSIAASPQLGAIDEAELVKTVLAELSKGTDGRRMMAGVWAQAKTLRVKRVQPFATARGKLMPLHIHRHR